MVCSFAVSARRSYCCVVVAAAAVVLGRELVAEVSAVSSEWRNLLRQHP